MDQAKRKLFINSLSRALDRENALTKREDGMALPDFVEPFDYSHGPQESMFKDLSREEILDMFFKECDKNGTKYVRTTEANLPQTVIEAINSWGNGVVAYPSVPQVDSLGIKAAFEADTSGERTYIQWDPALGREANLENINKADIGITFACAGIAETSTVIQPSTAESGRALSLIPDTHIAIIRADTIFPRMTQSMEFLAEEFRKNPEKFPRNVVHISGPSRTADIELVTVDGAHGPIKVTYIVID